MFDLKLICDWCGFQIHAPDKYTKDDDGNIYHEHCVGCLTDKDLLDVPDVPWNSKGPKLDVHKQEDLKCPD